MINKRITRFGYIINKNILTKDIIQKIKSDLTIKPKINGNYGKRHEVQFYLYLENAKYINVPKYYGINNFGIPEINDLETYDFPSYLVNYTGTLRFEQQKIVDKIIDGFEKHRGGLLIAGCGSGKTNMFIYIACYYKLKTLFLVHKTFLKNQIIERIKKITNIEKVGIIQKNKVMIDYPFTVGLIQSIAKRNYDDSIFKNFGLVIIDEVHHMGSKVFSTVYQKISTKYMLGASAEYTRNDETFNLINLYMGPILHLEEQKPNEMVIVKRYHYHTSNKKRNKVVLNNFTKEPDRATMISNLIYIKKRNRFIINLIKSLFCLDKNILCLTGRLKQVNLIYKILKLDDTLKIHVGKYIGNMSEDKLKISAQKKIILGTYSMAEEGLDINTLNVVIFCTPKSTIKQSVGRILRKENYQEHPIVVDIIDKNYIMEKQAEKRNRYYEKQNYIVQDFYVSDYEKDNYFLWNNKEFIDESLVKISSRKIKSKNINFSNISFLD